MRKTSTDGLIYVKDIGFIVPRVRIRCYGRTVIGYSARSMLLEETYHARATGLAEISEVIQKILLWKEHTPPLNQRARGAVSGFFRAAKNQNLGSVLLKRTFLFVEYWGSRTHQILSVAVRSP